MEKNKKDKEYDLTENLDTLFERLTQKALKRDAEKDCPYDIDPLVQYLRDKQDNGEDGDN